MVGVGQCRWVCVSVSVCVLSVCRIFTSYACTRTPTHTHQSERESERERGGKREKVSERERERERESKRARARARAREREREKRDLFTLQELFLLHGGQKLRQLLVRGRFEVQLVALCVFVCVCLCVCALMYL